MNEQENVQTVKQTFSALKEGDLQALLNKLADNVDWQSPVTRTRLREISWSKPRHSREEVASYFKELLEKVQPEAVEALEFTAQDDRVVVEGKKSGHCEIYGSYL